MDSKEVKKIANLASLALAEHEIEPMKSALTNILHLVGQLKQYDVSQLEPVTHPLEMCQPMREDEITEEEQREQLQASAPAVAGGFYLVPKVIDQDS